MPHDEGEEGSERSDIHVQLGIRGLLLELGPGPAHGPRAHHTESARVDLSELGLEDEFARLRVPLLALQGSVLVVLARAAAPHAQDSEAGASSQYFMQSCAGDARIMTSSIPWDPRLTIVSKRIGKN